MGFPQVAVVGGTIADPIDTPTLLAAFHEAGFDAHAVSWHDDAVDWTSFDLVLLRSCWDYVDDRDGFLEWTRGVARTTRLFNPVDVVAWNSDKTYLTELAALGLPAVPTAVVPDTGPVWPDGWAEIVIKPSVGCGSRQVARYRRDELDRAAEHAGALRSDGRVPLVQPLMPAVDSDGERSVYLVAGQPSHAVHRSAVLEPGAPPPAGFELADRQRVVPMPMDDELTALALDVADRLPGGRPLYARVDTIRHNDRLLILELELIEPVLFLDRNPSAVDGFVRAVGAALVSSPAGDGGGL